MTESDSSFIPVTENPPDENAQISEDSNSVSVLDPSTVKNTPADLPQSPPEVPDEPPEDPLEASNAFEQERMVGGSSLPALRSASPQSSGEPDVPMPSPRTNQTSPGANEDPKKEAVEKDEDDVEAELNEVLQKDSDAKTDRIFEDSDSDDSLFGSSLATSKAKKELVPPK